jgi:hypothetical protein
VGDPTKLQALFQRAKTADVADKLFGLWDDSAWSEAARLDSEDEYRNYLAHFPQGIHVGQAKNALEKLAHRRKQADEIDAWRTAREKGDRKAYEDYLSMYQAGMYAKYARRQLSELDYEEAAKRDTIEGYEEFLRNNHGEDPATKREPARKRLRQLMYERATTSDVLEDWVAFFDRHRNTKLPGDGAEVEQMKATAEAAMERLLYREIVASPSLELCQDYLKRYTAGPHKQPQTASHRKDGTAAI